MTLRFVSTINPVRDPGTSEVRRDFLASHYVFTRTQDAIAIQSKVRPDEMATVVPVWNVSCYGVETAMPAEAPTPEVAAVLGQNTRGVHAQRFQQGKRR